MTDDQITLHDMAGDLTLYRATARQRAEAFLRTLGKWDQSGDGTEMEKEVANENTRV